MHGSHDVLENWEEAHSVVCEAGNASMAVVQPPTSFASSCALSKSSSVRDSTELRMQAQQQVHFAAGLESASLHNMKGRDSVEARMQAHMHGVRARGSAESCSGRP